MFEIIWWGFAGIAVAGAIFVAVLKRGPHRVQRLRRGLAHGRAVRGLHRHHGRRAMSVENEKGKTCVIRPSSRQFS